MSSRDTKLAIAGALALLILLGGCAQIAVHSTVNSSGEVEEYQINVTMTRQAYGFLDNAAEEEGYENVRSYLLSDVNESVEEKMNYEQEFDGDTVYISMQLEEVKPHNSDVISVTTEDGQLVYEDTTFYNETATDTGSDPDSELAESIMSGLAVDYYLTMPGEITDTNADAVDGNTAEWHESGPDSFTDTRIYARSEKPTSIVNNGFGSVIAVLALALLTAFFAYRGRRE
ncbi:hypothetical protein [Haloferax gibbonsii]|uniref:Lipoprotein n=1 Tax=Haloferax gibbonsii TaxID=35746 RepID=A0A0K1IZN1_HALGI|nr:hypothetical protein [Haloferax gibbonsii]AKU09899.1 hypothetical protein ABY42_18960 [Haloferax gibbonsii]